MADTPQYTDILEALLLVTDRPLDATRIASVLPRVQAGEVPALIEALNRSYVETGRAFRIREIAGGYRLYTLPEYQTYVEALAVTSREARLSQAALETLAVIAYRQPVARGDVEYVRGCDCDGVLRTLLTRKLIVIKGRSDAPGRPLLYATTDRFLEYFGLSKIDDLPDWGEIAALVGDPIPHTRLTLGRGGEEAPAEEGLAPAVRADDTPALSPDVLDEEEEEAVVAVEAGVPGLSPADEA